MTNRGQLKALRNKARRRKPEADPMAETLALRRIGARTLRHEHLAAEAERSIKHPRNLSPLIRSTMRTDLLAANNTRTPKRFTAPQDDYERAVRGMVNPTQREVPGWEPVKPLPNPPKVATLVAPAPRDDLQRVRRLGQQCLQRLDEAMTWVQLWREDNSPAAAAMLVHWLKRVAMIEDEFARAERACARLGRARAARSSVLPARSLTVPAPSIEDLPGEKVRPNLDVVAELVALERAARSAMSVQLRKVRAKAPPPLPEVWRWATMPSYSTRTFFDPPRRPMYARPMPRPRVDD